MYLPHATLSRAAVDDLLFAARSWSLVQMATASLRRP